MLDESVYRGFQLIGEFVLIFNSYSFFCVIKCLRVNGEKSLEFYPSKIYLLIYYFTISSSFLNTIVILILHSKRLKHHRQVMFRNSKFITPTLTEKFKEFFSKGFCLLFLSKMFLSQNISVRFQLSFSMVFLVGMKKCVRIDEENNGKWKKTEVIKFSGSVTLFALKTLLLKHVLKPRCSGKMWLFQSDFAIFLLKGFQSNKI